MIQKHTPLSELLERDAVREALSADTDPLQNSITPQLVQNQVGGQLTGLRETGSETQEGRGKDKHTRDIKERMDNFIHLTHFLRFPSAFLSVLI